jgi:transketolase
MGLMRMLPNMTVICPCDFNQTRAATLAIAKHTGPVYMRFGRPKWPNFTPVDQEFVIGKAQVMREGKDVSVFAIGHLVWNALSAAEILQEKGIDAEVINIHTLKPLDENAVLNSIRKTGCAVSAEEHMRNGGLGDTIAQSFVRNFPAPLEMIAVNNTFGESGKPEELLKKFGLDVPDIVNAALKAITRKKERNF